MSASVGMLGGARAQYHLRQTFIFLNMYPMNSPELIVNFAQNKFDSNGRLIDEDTRKFLKRLLENLAWRSVGERRPNETSQWVGSNHLCYSCNVIFANNPFNYKHHEE